ncbi:ABC-2 transporter permease [Risungbinella massiliensis]|uniref:ABC-2 transporter permease n=1 Tax=Risungbinella massiliensis TaxID=1329796 RepID=UPI0005CB95BC|nr:ABC-2 transporter permease [Risungbinella massiliensis]
MFNLILKDYHLQRLLMIFYISMICLYLFTDLHATLSVVIVSSMFVINSHYYDERGQTNLLLNSLPYSRKQIIGSKYIGGLIFTTITTLATIGIYSVAQLLGYPVAIPSLENVLLIYLLVMLFTAFYLPIFYKFTQRYLISIFSLLYILMMALAKNLYSFFADKIPNIGSVFASVSNWQLFLMATMFIFVIYAISWFISIRIYENKDF